MAGPVIAAAAESTGIMEGVGIAGASGTASTTAGGTTAGSGGSGIASSIASGSGINLDLNALIAPWNNFVNNGVKKQMYKREQFLIDRQFQQNQKQFGLQYALQKYALENNIEYRDAALAYQKSMDQQRLGLEKPAAVMGLKAQEMELENSVKRMKNQKKFGTAYLRGLAKGFSKGGK